MQLEAAYRIGLSVITYDSGYLPCADGLSMLWQAAILFYSFIFFHMYICFFMLRLIDWVIAEAEVYVFVSFGGCKIPYLYTSK